VVGPSHDRAVIRSVQLVGLTSSLALLVVVLSDGAIEKRSIDIPVEVDDISLSAAGSHLAAHLVGATIVDPVIVTLTGDQVVDAVVAVALEALQDISGTEDQENIFVGGSSRMAAAFEAVETVRSVLSILEQQLVVVELIEDILDRGLSVAIGAEHGFEPLASCAIVVAPVSVDGRAAGTIGVLGPTRMNYPKALAVVEVVGKHLGERLARSAAGDSVFGEEEDGTGGR
jgi:heat-inducible transcriptional repressor